MGITIFGWVLLIIGIICAIGGIALAIFFATGGAKGLAIVSVLIGFIVAAALIGGVLIYSSTEAGKRAYKDQESNFSSRITRTVTVYDINGDIIKQYSGKFDVETGNADYILFDDENGKRHIIYYSIGIVTIDEE